MSQIISVIISFLLIPILIRKRVKLSYTLLIAALTLGLLSGVGINAVGSSVLSILRDNSSLTTILTVFMVAILGGIMKHYGLLDKIVNTMVLLIRNKKNILAIVPFLMGFLVIPGGAMLSAPFVNEIGEDLDVPGPRRAAINLIFRHLPMFILPYATQILLVLATVPQIDYPRLILNNLIFVIIIIISGYTIFLKDVKVQKSPPIKNFWGNLSKLLLYISPIYMAVIINLISGWPFYITLIGSVMIVYFISDKKDFLKVVYKSINWDTIITIAAVLIIKDLILNMEGLLEVFNNMFAESNSLFSMLLIFFISSVFFGLITGNIMGPLAIVLPMVAQLDLSLEMLYVLVYFVYGASFIGYYFSPLHLCQVFTLDIMRVTTGELYREYRVYGPVVLILFIASTFIMRLILV